MATEYLAGQRNKRYLRAGAEEDDFVDHAGDFQAEREKFRDMAESELVSLHEGNFARYQIRPGEFETWQHLWGERKKS
jgi:hypothetical protein